MASLRDYIFYTFPPGFVAFFVFTAAVLLAPILLGEALAFRRAANGARHRRWQQGLASIWLVVGLATLALAGGSWTLYLPLRGNLSFEVADCCSEHPFRDIPGGGKLKQILGIYETLAVPSVVWLVIAYALALVSLVTLAVLRRQAEAAVDTAASAHVMPPTDGT